MTKRNLVIAALAVLCLGAGAAPRLPEFTQTAPDRWLGSPPLRVASLQGHVVVLDVWTTDCWNCYRSFPWLKTVQQRFAPQGLKLVSVHSPEFDREKQPARTLARLREYGLEQTPTMLDDDLRYWNALGNRYWPAFYLVDKRGIVRRLLVGEQHAGQPNAVAFEAAIQQLLDE